MRNFFFRGLEDELNVDAPAVLDFVQSHLPPVQREFAGERIIEFDIRVNNIQKWFDDELRHSSARRVVRGFHKIRFVIHEREHEFANFFRSDIAEVGVEEDEMIVPGILAPGLQRATFSAIDLVPDDAHSILPRDEMGPVFAPVVDDDDFRNFLDSLCDADDSRDAFFFVERGDDAGDAVFLFHFSHRTRLPRSRYFCQNEHN